MAGEHRRLGRTRDHDVDLMTARAQMTRVRLRRACFRALPAVGEDPRYAHHGPDTANRPRCHPVSRGGGGTLAVFR